MAKLFKKFGYFILLTYPIFWLGIGRKYPFVLLGSNGVAIGNFFWGILTITWIILFFYPKIWQKILTQFENKIFIAWLLIGVLLIPVFDLFQWIFFKRIGYPFPTFLLIFDLGLFFFIILKRKSYSLLKIACIAAILHRGFSILTFPLTYQRSDMLSEVHFALQRLLIGQNPYTFVVSGVNQILYLPLGWLNFIPTYLLKIDLRWMGFVYLILIGIITTRWLNKRKNNLGNKLAILWFLNPYLAFRHELYLDFFWFLILVITITAISQKKNITTLLVGLSMATLQWSWIVAPFWLILANRKQKLHRFWISYAISISIAALIMFPFIIFYNGLTLKALGTYEHMIKGQLSELCFGLAPLFYQLKISFILPFFQIILLIVLFLWAIKKRSNAKLLRILPVIAFFYFYNL